MKINKYSDVILDEKDLLRGLYTGQLRSFSGVNVEDPALITRYNDAVEANADHLSKLTQYVQPECSIEEFDRLNQTNWFIPEDYKTFDIVTHLVDKCKTQVELDRVLDELQLYSQHEMIEVLICLKYLVDFMREKDIVWGLGRGSSVSSYCLYLLGVHKIDSIKYQLDIKEFLKGENNGNEEDL